MSGCPFLQRMSKLLKRTNVQTVQQYILSVFGSYQNLYNCADAVHATLRRKPAILYLPNINRYFAS